jgi:hypothetical protein
LPNAIDRLKEKIQYYKDNDARVTAERIDRAKAEIAKLEAEAEAEANKPADEVSENSDKVGETPKEGESAPVEAAA